MTATLNLDAFNAALRTELYALEHRYDETEHPSTKHLQKLIHAIVIWNTNNPNFIVSDIYVIAKVIKKNTPPVHKVFLRVNSEYGYILSPNYHVLGPIGQFYTREEINTYKVIHTFKKDKNFDS